MSFARVAIPVLNAWCIVRMVGHNRDADLFDRLLLIGACEARGGRVSGPKA
jgi:hypothetical protein